MSPTVKEIRLPPMVSESQLRTLVRQAIELRRHALVFAAAELWEEAMRGAPRLEAEAVPAETQWRQIASLSQLRAVVGVRFQKLRDNWVAAGFPLREHRGDRPIRPEVSDDSWATFSGWLLTEGYQVRRAPTEADWFFEIASRDERRNGR